MRSLLHFALLAPLAAVACTSSYHPEYHPVTVTSVNQEYSGAPVTVVPVQPAQPPVTVVPARPPVTVIPAQPPPLMIPAPALADPNVVFR